MEPSSMHYFPLAWPFLLLLGLLFLIEVALVQFRAIAYAYGRMGINPRYVFAILLLSLVGSYVNIPIATLSPEPVVSESVVTFYGVPYVVPMVHDGHQTTLAVNVGGALIPAALSLYLLVKNRLFVRGLIAIAVVAVVTHHFAQPVRGIGISVPIFVPPVAAALVAMILAWRNPPPLAYIAGSLGTLIGADLLNLDKIAGMGAPVASIGGAGTFDGVFLSGIIAVLLPPVGTSGASQARG
jgi:uncharacterized membrane protein